jgi:hypothetical protein
MQPVEEAKIIPLRPQGRIVPPVFAGDDGRKRFIHQLSQFLC